MTADKQTERLMTDYKMVCLSEYPLYYTVMLFVGFPKAFISQMGMN